MAKVKLIFPTLFQLWDFKQVFRKSVLQTICRKHSLICLCTEAQIELAVHAYRAKVIAIDWESKSHLPADPFETIYTAD